MTPEGDWGWSESGETITRAGGRAVEIWFRIDETENTGIKTGLVSESAYQVGSETRGNSSDPDILAIFNTNALLNIHEYNRYPPTHVLSFDKAIYLDGKLETSSNALV